MQWDTECGVVVHEERIIIQSSFEETPSPSPIPSPSVVASPEAAPAEEGGEEDGMDWRERPQRCSPYSPDPSWP